MDIKELLILAKERSASDLHLNVGTEPVLRIDGKLKKLGGSHPITTEEMKNIIEQVTDGEQRELFHKKKELDFSYTIPGLSRNRVNACFQKGNISIAFRLLSYVLSPLESLGLPPIYGDLSLKPRGLILVTGPTGSGKTTSLAAMIKHVNLNQERYIITIEDPVEYVHENIKSIIIQRNIGDDSESFSEALRGSLRHDPDVIVVGEMRDLITISTALSAAETGHLVLATLHTLDAPETINRIVDAFPSEQQAQIVLQLSQVLIAVLSQTLVPLINGGRIAACEIMISNSAIKHTIRQKQVHLLHGIMELARKEGMQTLNSELGKMVRDGRVLLNEALSKSCEPEALLSLIKPRKQETQENVNQKIHR